MVVYILGRVILVNKLDKKGFSLVELIGVVALLGLIVVIASTSGLGAFNNAKDKLKEEDEKTIVEAAKVLMTEILYCDDNLDIELLENDDANDLAYINGFTTGNVKCANLLNKSKGTGLVITLDYLIDNELVTGSEIIKLKGEGVTYTGKIDLTSKSIEVTKN